MIKNILFDMGNVLIRFEPKQYVKNAGLSESDQQLLLRELYGSIDWVRLDRGTLTEAEVIDRCVSRVGEHLRGAVEKLVGHWDRPELPVEGMKALTDELYEKGVRAVPSYERGPAPAGILAAVPGGRALPGGARVPLGGRASPQARSGVL